MKPIDQKIALIRGPVSITFADTGYVIFAEGSNSRGEFTTWRGVVMSMPEVYAILDRINTMEKAE